MGEIVITRAGGEEVGFIFIIYTVKESSARKLCHPRNRFAIAWHSREMLQNSLVDPRKFAITNLPFFFFSLRDLVIWGVIYV